ncbi:MAG: hypothetical protein R3344_09965, partial [Acidobacteriota bacterium]|nr:hypothetical protein [Acidobacteriota bacterium]
IYSKRADGTGTVEQLSDGVDGSPSSITPDGAHILFRSRERIGMLSLDDERSSRILLADDFIQRNGEVSPDGRWLAYESNESGQFEIYVRSFPDVEAGRWQISTSGGTRPLWSPNGRELYYLGLDNRLMAAPVEIRESFQPGTPERLLDKGYYLGPPGRPYDIAPDGERFLMLERVRGDEEMSRPPSFTLVLNWLEELKERVPPR